MRLPALVVHCDWSTSPDKRWMSTAILDEGRFRLTVPSQVGPVDALLESLVTAERAPVLIGFDFPIGLPHLYGRQTGLADFRECLRTFGNGEWADWFSVVDDRGDLSIRRPFYPSRPGGRSQEHLTTALGVHSINELRRMCEMPTPAHGAGCPLFWTLGGNQVGKAAIAGWREFVVPALREPGTALWPFDGSIEDLLDHSSLVIAETYPADAYGQIGIKFGPRMSKRRQADRQTFSGRLLKWAEERDHIVDPNLEAIINDGFGDKAVGEDIFDAFLGLCGMLEVVGGHRSDGVTARHQIRQWEGWIFGQSAAHLPDTV